MILKLKSVDSEAEKCGFVKKNHTFSIVCHQKQSKCDNNNGFTKTSLFLFCASKSPNSNCRSYRKGLLGFFVRWCSNNNFKYTEKHIAEGNLKLKHVRSLNEALKSAG